MLETSSRAARRPNEGRAEVPGGRSARLARAVAAVVGLYTMIIGGWAMLDPESWDAAVALFPPYNRHLVHDVGAFMLGLGACLLLALRRRDALLVALGGNAVAAVAHFVSHVLDRSLGGRPSDPLVFGLIALVLVLATAARLRAGEGR